MPQVKTSASFTKATQPYNGLTADQLVNELIDQPHGRRYAVVAFEVLRITEEIEEGTKVPTVKFVQIEPLEGEAADVAKRLMEEAYNTRTGRDDAPQDTLPFDDGPVAERPRDEWLDDTAQG